MNLEHLETFQEVCRQRSFGGAATRLGISQPSVSYRIQSLEKELGSVLFEEPRRTVILTSEGKRVLEFAERWISQANSLKHVLASGGEPTEPLRVVAPGSIGRTLLFPILCKEVFAQHPIVLLFRDAAEVFDVIASGQCDVGLNYRPTVSSSLHLTEACREEFVLVFSSALTGPTAVTPEQLAKLPFVTYEECDYVFGHWFDTVAGGQPPEVRSAHHFTRLEEVIEMVRLGRGVSIVPLPAAREALDSGQVRQFVVPGRRCLNANYLVTRAGWTPPPAVSILADELRSHSA